MSSWFHEMNRSTINRSCHPYFPIATTNPCLVTRFPSISPFALSRIQLIELGKESVLVMVISTTGQGDPPDNARTFLRQLRKITDKTYFSRLKLAILGLGDSNYDRFNQAAKATEKLLVERGATKFIPTALADDGVGYVIILCVFSSPKSTFFRTAFLYLYYFPSHYPLLIPYCLIPYMYSFVLPCIVLNWLSIHGNRTLVLPSLHYIALVHSLQSF